MSGAPHLAAGRVRAALTVGEADLDPRALEVVAVEARDRAVDALFGGELEQRIAAGIPGRAVLGQLDAADASDAGEEGDQVALGGGFAQILDEKGRLDDRAPPGTACAGASWRARPVEPPRADS